MKRLTILITVFSLFFSAFAAADLQQESVHDVWRVDLHSLAGIPADGESFAKLSFFQWKQSGWVLSDAETFFTSQQQEIPLIVFAPGYTSTTVQTTRVGNGVVQLFDPAKPCRVVFWDWFSDRVRHGIRRDIRSKIPIAAEAGDYLTLFLQSLKPQSKVCLFGFSFGTRIICDAVRQIDGKQPEGLRLHVVLSAAAMDRDWLAQSSRHGNVPRIAEKVLITYNRSDWALRFYPLLNHIGHFTNALGLTGPPLRSIAPEYRSRIEAFQLDPYIGNEHKTLKHVQTPVFRSRINEYFFFETSESQ